MIAIIKYNAGNVLSVQYALKRLGYDARVTDDQDELKSADKVIFPGVGNANAAMLSLKESNLDTLIKELTQPVLGICVGMQLMCNSSEENNTTGLGIMALEVKKFQSPNHEFKIPQIGWNTITGYKSVLLEGLKNNSFVYYVHSFYAEIGRETVATSEYIIDYSAVIQKDNFYGVQFHAEKSAEAGDRILLNFLNL